MSKPKRRSLPPLQTTDEGLKVKNLIATRKLPFDTFEKRFRAFAVQLQENPNTKLEWYRAGGTQVASGASTRIKNRLEREYGMKVRVYRDYVYADDIWIVSVLRLDQQEKVNA